MKKLSLFIIVIFSLFLFSCSDPYVYNNSNNKNTLFIVKRIYHYDNTDYYKYKSYQPFEVSIISNEKFRIDDTLMVISIRQIRMTEKRLINHEDTLYISARRESCCK